MTSLEGTVARGPSRTPFELRMLTGLPCGCVIADFEAVTLDVEMVSVEAKGPHCRLGDHRAGRVLAIGGSTEVDSRALRDLEREETAA